MAIRTHDVVGSNGVASIPSGNFVGWMCTASEAAIYKGGIAPSAENLVAARDRRTLPARNTRPWGFGGVRWAFDRARTTAGGVAALATFGCAAGAGFADRLTARRARSCWPRGKPAVWPGM